jgi:hypothetical protein
MAWQRSLQAAIRSLRREEQNILKDLDSVRDRIAELRSFSGAGFKGRRGRRRPSRSNRLSAKGREAISRAAKRRWAEYRARKRKQTH